MLIIVDENCKMFLVFGIAWEEVVDAQARQCQDAVGELLPPGRSCNIILPPLWVISGAGYRSYRQGGSVLRFPIFAVLFDFDFAGYID